MALDKNLNHKFTNLLTMINDISWQYMNINKCLYSGFLKADDVPSDLSFRYGDFHEYTDDNGDTCYRKTMGLHKLAAEYITRSIFAEEPEISISNKVTEEWIKQQFEDTNFIENEIELTETWIALGGKAKVPVRENGETGIDFIEADGFKPTQWKNKEVTGGVFITQRTEVIEGVTWFYTLLQWYEWGSEVPLTIDPETNEILTTKAGFFIKTEVFKSRKMHQLETRCFGDLQNVFGFSVDEIQTEIDFDMPIFQYTKLPIKNNKQFRSPLGIGLMTNALDEEKASDESFDSLSVEIDFGRKSVAVGEPAQTEGVAADGTTHKKYNQKKRAYLFQMDTVEPIVADMSGPLRTAEIIAALNTQLDIFAVKIGLNAGTFRFDGKSIVTATQIKTEKSESARTIRMIENALARDWKQFIIKYIHFHNKTSGENIPEVTEKDIEITFHDNIILDDDTAKTKFIEEINNDISTEWEYRVKFKGETEEQAKAFIETEIEQQPSIVDEIEEEENNPISKPRPGESQDEFIARFMANDEMQREFPDEEQRSKVAFDTWRGGGS